MAYKEIKEIVGLVMLGEGITGFFAPKKYSLFWKIGYAPIEKLKHKAAAKPELMRLIYAAEAGFGFWLARKQFNRSIENKKRIE